VDQFQTFVPPGKKEQGEEEEKEHNREKNTGSETPLGNVLAHRRHKQG
jgi:hypothetical protein